MSHLNYYLDLCAETYIVNGDAVLLRLHEKYNYWLAPGGHIDPGEDANQASLREVWEETGLSVTLVGPADWNQTDTETNQDLVPPLFMNRHAINATHEHSALVFVAKAEHREVAPQEEASVDVPFKWCTQSDLDELLRTDQRLRPETHRYASKAIALVARETAPNKN